MCLIDTLQATRVVFFTKVISNPSSQSSNYSFKYLFTWDDRSYAIPDARALNYFRKDKSQVRLSALTQVKNRTYNSQN